MKRTTALTLVALVVASGVFFSGVIEPSTNSIGAQDGERTDPTVETIPNRTTALQNESASLTVRIHNQVNDERFVLVRVFEPSGVSGMRVDGEAPKIPQNNTEMWQSSETLNPRQRLAIPITIEPGSDPGEHTVPVQVKYFDESSTYTGTWETGLLVVGQCSATCRARGTVAVVFDFLVSYRNTIVAVLSLTVAILSLSSTMQRRRK